MDDFDGDRAAERLLLGAVDPPHAADTNQLLDDVAARKRRVDEGILVPLDQLSDREPAHRAKLVRGLARIFAVRADDFRHARQATTLPDPKQWNFAPGGRQRKAKSTTARCTFAPVRCESTRVGRYLARPDANRDSMVSLE